MKKNLLIWLLFFLIICSLSVCAGLNAKDGMRFKDYFDRPDNLVVGAPDIGNKNWTELGEGVNHISINNTKLKIYVNGDLTTPYTFSNFTNPITAANNTNVSFQFKLTDADDVSTGFTMSVLQEPGWSGLQLEVENTGWLTEKTRGINILPINDNQWYNLSFVNINWVTYKYDVKINKTLFTNGGNHFKFSLNVSSLNRVYLQIHKTGHTSAFIDNMTVGRNYTAPPPPPPPPVGNISLGIPSPHNNTQFNYLQIPFQVNVSSNGSVTVDLYLNGTLNQSVKVDNESYSCYQEFVNVSTFCGGRNTGIYSFTGNWLVDHPSSYAVDGIWDTYAERNGSSFIIMNYTKPNLATNNSIWRIKGNTSFQDLKVPASCWNADVNDLRFRWRDSSWSCRTNISTWLLLASVFTDRIYEESMVWDMKGWVNQTIDIDVNCTGGGWNYYFFANNSYGQNDTTKYSHFWVDITDPVITTDFVNNSLFYRRNLTGQFNFSDNLYLHGVNFSIDDDQFFGVLDINDTFYQYNLSRDVTNLSFGRHVLSVRVADGHTSNKLLGDYDWSNGLWNDYLQFNFKEPYSDGWINFEQKDGSVFDNWNAEEKLDKYVFSFKPNKVQSSYIVDIIADKKISIVNKPDTKYENWLIYDDHWIDFSPYTTKFKRINNNRVEATILNPDLNKELIFSSIGDLNIVTKNYTFFTVNASESYSDPILNLFNTTFYFNLTGNFSTLGLADVILEFNHTNYSASLVSNTSTLLKYEKDLFIDLTFHHEINKSHHWYFNFSLGSIEQTSPQNQTVYEVLFGKCGIGNLSYFVLNMSYYDEASGLAITADNDYDLIIYDGTYYYNRASNFTGRYSDTFCTNIPPGAITYNWNLWGDISLSKSAYATRLYDINAISPWVISNNPELNQSLFLLRLNESNTVTFHWLSTSFQELDGTMRIYKCFGGNKTLVESLPVISGTGIANIELLTQSYAYDFIYEGTVYESDPGFSQCHLEAATEITYYIDVGVDLGDYLGLQEILCTLKKTSNETVQMNWTSNPETLGYVSGCIKGYRQHINGSLLVYNNCSSSSEGYSRSVRIPMSGYTYTIKGFLQQGNYSAVCGRDVVFYTAINSAILFGLSALFAVFLLVASMVLFYAGDGFMQLLGASIGFVVSWVLGILYFENGLITITCIVILLAIVAGVGRYNR